MSDTETKTTTEQKNVFQINDCALIAIATGDRAMNLKELRDTLSRISPDSVYYHFWGGLLQPRFEEREYNNDFAAWAWYGLHDATLAERLAVVDPTEFATLEDLRQELLEIIEERQDQSDHLSYVLASSRFEFIRSQIVIFDSLKRAESPEMLAELMPTLSTGSIFYHFIDARRRLEKHDNDFTCWLNGYGERYHDLCRQLTAIDPYFGTLAQIKSRLADIFTTYFA